MAICRSGRGTVVFYGHILDGMSKRGYLLYIVRNPLFWFSQLKELPNFVLIKNIRPLIYAQHIVMLVIHYP